MAINTVSTWNTLQNRAPKLGLNLLPGHFQYLATNGATIFCSPLNFCAMLQNFRKSSSTAVEISITGSNLETRKRIVSNDK